MHMFENAPFKLFEMKGPFASFSFANEEEKQAVTALADKALSYELTPLTATLYMEYARNGNRTHYQSPYHARRDALHSLLLGYLACQKEQYIDKMIDMIWAITEETSWVIPAHNISHPYELAGKPLPDAFADDIVEIDLFSAETASLLSWVYHFMKDELDAVTPVICERIRYEITRRILNPFRKLEMRWMTNFVNNWTPWIVSNVLTVAAIFIEQPRELRMMISISMGYLDRFVDTYGEDGGCNEGASYWTAAVAALFDAVGILHDITGGSLNFFHHPLLRKMCEYFPDVCISPKDRLVANFADCPQHVNADRRLFMRMGNLVDSEKMKQFAQIYAANNDAFKLSGSMIYRELCSLTEPIPEKKTEVTPADNTAWYPNLQLATLRRGDFFLAVKGGHNRESHNHNDLGNFILYRNALPVIIDVGVGVYTKDTFSEKRYTIWTMQSSYHNLPEIDGMMQLPGREYHTDSFTRENDTVSVSYRSAYPETLAATAVLRTFTAKKDEIRIHDEIHGAKTAVFHLMLCEEPQTIEGGFAVGGCQVLFDGEYFVDAIDITYDENLHRDWARDTLYRVRIPSAGTLETVIKKA